MNVKFFAAGMMRGQPSPTSAQAHEKNRQSESGPRMSLRIHAMLPSEISGPASSGSSSSWRRDLLWLAVGFALLYAFRLGSDDLSNPDDGRYAEIPREMLATGDWVTPRLNGVNYFEKPPLMYWLTAISMKCFGLNEWATGAVPALFGLGGVLLTYAAARKLYDRESGLLSAGVLGTSLLYFIIAHMLLLDMAVSVLMSATLFCFILGVRAEPGARRRWLFYG